MTGRGISNLSSLVVLRRKVRSSRLLQIVLILGLWLVGEAVSRWSRLPVPGSIFGLFILLALLSSGALSVRTVRRGAYWFLGEMLLFFVPALVAVLDHPEFVGWLGVRIFLAIFLGTLIVMVTTGLAVEIGYRWTIREKERHESAQ